MVRKILLLLSAMLLLFSSAMAEGQVHDQARLFSASDISRMEEIIVRIEEEHQVDMVVLTTNNVPNDFFGDMIVVRDYADDYYDNGGFGMGEDASGMLILLDMNNRVVWLSTSGVMIDFIDDAREEDILDHAYNYLSVNRYAEGMIAALSRVETFMNRGRAEGAFRYDEVTGKRLSGIYNTLTTMELGVAFLAAAGVALIVYLSINGSYNLKGSTYSYDQASNSSIVLTQDDEAFVRQFVTRTPKNINTGSGGSGGGRSGGSGVHRSSGGRSHGGGGRRF